MKTSPFNVIGYTLLLIVLWVGAIVVRREVFSQQTRTIQDREAPFLMESALQFRMTQMVQQTGTLPKIDDKVQVPDGVNMRETYSVGAEWIYTALANLLPKEWTFTARVRWVSTALFSLAIPLAALWIGLKYRSGFSGALTGLFLAVSPAFVVRSSGLELSRENLAIPFFTLFFLAEHLARVAPLKRKQWLCACLAAGSLALAQMFWDLTQYITGLWIVWSFVTRLSVGKESPSEKIVLLTVTVSQIFVAVANPYLRSHSFFFSPVMALLVARTLISYIPTLQARWKVMAIPLAFLAFWLVLGHFFVENYSHFGELLYAKIRFLNVKPEDPALLTYAQRIMWTPALNSSTWQLTKAYFPISLYLFGLAVLVLIRGMKHGRYRFQTEFFFAGFTLVVYIFFFRFHVFLILFIAACIGALFASTKTKKGMWRRWFFPLIGILTFIGVESYFLLFFEPKPAGKQLAEQKQLQQLIKAMGGDGALPKGNRWGRPGAAYGYLASLSEELLKLPQTGPVLANFGISASILAETEMPIVLHPKFETPGIRERVRQFYEHLFLKSEKELRDWAVSFGAKYYVHSNGNFSNLDIVNSPRYMVDALEPPAEASIYTLENHPEKATWFQPLYSNRRYRIFKIITPEDEDWAKRMTRLARIAYESGDLEGAKKRSLQALSYHWKYAPAQRVYQAALSQPQR